MREWEWFKGNLRIRVGTRSLEVPMHRREQSGRRSSGGFGQGEREWRIQPVRGTEIEEGEL